MRPAGWLSGVKTFWSTYCPVPIVNEGEERESVGVLTATLKVPVL